MLEKAFKGDLSTVKSKIGPSDIPKEAISILTGLQASETVSNIIKIASLGNQSYEVDLQDLNAIELACVGGHHKLLSYLTDELNLRSARDFQLHDKGGIVDAMQFIAVPIMKHDRAIVEVLLKHSNMWSQETYFQVLTLMKQLKWTEGIAKVALGSKTAQEMFANSNLEGRFRFIRDHLAFAFRIPEHQEHSDS
jgi:hypothetical protein